MLYKKLFAPCELTKASEIVRACTFLDILTLRIGSELENSISKDHNSFIISVLMFHLHGIL
jgi:hypothetical protein